MLIIKKLSTVAEMLHHLNVIAQLGQIKSIEQYEALLSDMVKNGYQQMVAFRDETCVAICGFWINTKLYSGKYVELDNVIIDEAFRNQGIGELLCSEVEKEAIKQGCKAAMLDCYVENKRAHGFYERLNYKVIGYHFHKDLENKDSGSPS